MATNYDIWAETRRVAEKLALPLSTHHVKAHQDRRTAYADLFGEAQVNCDMDKAAEDMRESDAQVPPIPVFQSSKVAILLGNIVLTDNINMRLRHHLTAPALQNYLQGRFHWTDATFRSIDWITIGKYLRSVPHAKLTNLIKLQHGWQYTTARQRKIEGHADQSEHPQDLCPLGCGCIEINHHYLTCPEQPGYRHVKRETQSLEDALTRSGTHPDLQRILLHSIRRFLSGDTPTLNWTRTDHLTSTIVNAFNEQCAIGWDHLFLGRLSMKWKYAQHLFIVQERTASKQPPNKPRSTQLWTKDLCQQLMHLKLNCWQIRNEAYHQDNKSKNEHNRERQLLITEVTD